jgi:intracellular septation protein
MSERQISVAGTVIVFGPAIVLGLTYLLAPLPQDDRIYLGVGAFAMATIARDVLFPKEDVLATEFFDIPWLFYLLIIVVPAVAFSLADVRIIKAGPTLYFAWVAVLSAWSASTDRPRLQRFVRRVSLRNIGRDGWRSLTWYAAGCCLLMALVNELVWRNSSTGFWFGFQLFGWLVVRLLLMGLSMRIFSKYDSGSKGRAKALEPSR